MRFPIFGAVFALPIAAHAAAQIFSLSPSADALLSAANASSNYGGSGALAVSASGLPKGEFQSLLQFDLAPARSSFDAIYGVGAWSIQSITLSLAAASPNNALFNGNGAGPGGSNVNFAGQFSLEWLQNDAWVEGSGSPQAPGSTGITFGGLPGLLGASDEMLGTFSFSGATAGSTAYSLALTPAFAADATGGSVVTFLAKPADSGVSMLVNSRTGSIFSRPTLTVVAVPEPGAAALVVTGLLMVCGKRRRR